MKISLQHTQGEEKMTLDPQSWVFNFLNMSLSFNFDANFENIFSSFAFGKSTSPLQSINLAGLLRKKLKVKRYLQNFQIQNTLIRV